LQRALTGRQSLKEQFGSEFAASRLTRDAQVMNAAEFGGASFKEPAKVIKLGTIISEFADDGMYDIPTFIRNQADYK